METEVWVTTKENMNKELVIQIEWRQIQYLYFAYQSQILLDDA